MNSPKGAAAGLGVVDRDDAHADDHDARQQARRIIEAPHVGDTPDAARGIVGGVVRAPDAARDSRRFPVDIGGGIGEDARVGHLPVPPTDNSIDHGQRAARVGVHLGR